mgnify:CR=1 FL=1
MSSETVGAGEAVDLARIEAARQAGAGLVKRTPIVSSVGLSTAAGGTVTLKAENLQRTGAFKIRGASNCILQLTEDERAHGVITASAGNHAQGVAVAARAAGAPATIVMPEITPVTKVLRTQELGAHVILHGESFDEAEREAYRLAYFFFNDTATTEIYTLSLHDALPIFYILQVIFKIPMRSNTFCFEYFRI